MGVSSDWGSERRSDLQAAYQHVLPVGSKSLDTLLGVVAYACMAGWAPPSSGDADDVASFKMASPTKPSPRSPSSSGVLADTGPNSSTVGTGNMRLLLRSHDAGAASRSMQTDSDSDADVAAAADEHAVTNTPAGDAELMGVAVKAVDVLLQVNDGPRQTRTPTCLL